MKRCKSWNKEKHYGDCCLKPSQSFGPQIEPQPTRWQYPLITYPDSDQKYLMDEWVLCLLEVYLVNILEHGHIYFHLPILTNIVAVKLFSQNWTAFWSRYLLFNACFISSRVTKNQNWCLMVVLVFNLKRPVFSNYNPNQF